MVEAAFYIGDLIPFGSSSHPESVFAASVIFSAVALSRMLAFTHR